MGRKSAWIALKNIPGVGKKEKGIDNMRKNKLTVMMLTAALVIGITGCAGQTAATETTKAVETETVAKETETTVQETESADTEGQTRIVKDTWGREVEIPEKVTSIVCLGSGAPRMAVYLDVEDKMVGIEEHDAEGVNILRDYSPILSDEARKLPLVGAGGGSGANNGYAEAIIMADPDVILAGFSQEAAEELEGQTGIPVVCVRYTSKGLANESFYSAMRVFAEVVGSEERCEELLTYIDQCKEDLDNRTSEIADEDKPAAYAGAVTFSGRHGFTGTYSKFGPFDAVHAKNVADVDTEDGYYEADLEQILTWDPDVIFLDPGNMDLVSDEISGNPEYFKSVRAIEEEKVYSLPSFNNCGMNITYALMDAYYAGMVLYPEQFEDLTMEDKSDEILTTFLGEDTFSQMNEGGLIYGTLNEYFK